jgi:hypothetical protein
MIFKSKGKIINAEQWQGIDEQNPEATTNQGIILGESGSGWIKTYDGLMVAINPSDWIIKDMVGQVTGVKADLFFTGDYTSAPELAMDPSFLRRLGTITFKLAEIHQNPQVFANLISKMHLLPLKAEVTIGGFLVIMGASPQFEVIRVEENEDIPDYDLGFLVKEGEYTIDVKGTRPSLMGGYTAKGIPVEEEKG